MSAKTRQSLLRAKLARQILSGAKGFTLIELLVVIVIVGVLSAVAIPQFLNQVRRSRTAEAQAALTAVGRGSEAYRLDTTQYPDNYTRIEYGCPSSTDVDSCGANGDKFMNDPWSAPNYDDPVASDINSVAPQGMRWDTTANAAKTQFINSSGNPIQCTIGLGSRESVVVTEATFVGKSCNVFD
ncbi:prepilin-type N-terminal cleavage/methylation domain-containing protein [Synechococcus sp. Nb3U1]|uniref:type IV pilin protein n=1 Tax=Synechococcus sp. Nb3U1 TaxID=1914529 RepID=UPI001F35FE8A|nr:prepilin-type N-terminal cleavage/methylation domain-containing protein [Synechococcus sp. Nb3U1]MCF2971747.1 prepilin-type N-terminal cleavage/methylation domain-containing protein [Synechococcus sp. Nb3U1]